MLRQSIKDSLPCTLATAIMIAVTLIFSLLTANVAAAQSSNDVTLWLQWLGVEAAAAQADRIIEQEIRQLPVHQLPSEKHVQQMRQHLLTHTGNEMITAGVTSFVIKHFPQSSGDLAQILRHPLMERARNFNVVMEMDGAFKKFTAFDNKRSREPPDEKRIALLRRLDKAQRSSHIAALMQTQLHTTVTMLAGKMTSQKNKIRHADWLALQKKQRERYMSDVLVRLHLFSYRFMKDEELRDYVQLMESRSVQLVLDVAVRGFHESLTAARLNTLKSS